MCRIFLSFIVCIFFFATSTAQEEKVDSIILLAKKMRGSNPNNSIVKFKEAQDLAKEIDYSFGEVYAFYLGLKMTMYDEKYGEKMDELVEMQKKVKGTKHEKLLAELDYLRGTIAASNGLIDTGMIYLNKSIAWFLEHDMKGFASLPYIELAKIYINRKDKIAAKTAIEQVYNNIEDEEPMLKYISLFNIVSLSLNIEDFEAYNTYLEETIELGKSFKMLDIDDSGHDVAKFILNIEDDSLEQKLIKALPFQKQNDRASLTLSTLSALASMSEERGDYQQAMEYHLDSEKYAKTLFQRVGRYSKLYENRKKAGDSDAALEYYESYQQGLDSIYIEESQNNIDRLQVELQTVEKDHAIKIKTRQRNYLLAGLALLSLFGFSLIYNLKRRNRLNQEIYRQQNELDNQRILQLENDKKLARSEALLEGQEKERSRIAQDLHDGLGGMLTTVKAHYTNIMSQAEEIKKMQVSDNVENLIDEACTEVRRISHDLMPNSLRLNGIESAVESLVHDLESVHALDVDVQLDTLDNSLRETQLTMLFRVIQELCNNIVKYASAKNVFLQIRKHENEIVVLVEDDGIGFNLEEALQKKGLGLKSIYSRVDYLKGAIDFNTKPGEGSSVTINIPFN